MYPIRILSPDLELLGEIDSYDTFEITRSWQGTGEFDLLVNRAAQNADKLEKHNIIILHGNTEKAGIIRHCEISVDENGAETENWQIQGVTLDGITKQRVTLPPDHTAYDRRSGQGETVLKHYVENNLTDPDKTNRKVEQLAIAEDEERGDHVSFESRYKELHEELETIAKRADIGWHIYVDYDQPSLVFDVIEGKDVTADQSDNPPVIFSPEYQSISEQTFIDSLLDYVSDTYVGGQGEGTDRLVHEVGEESEGIKRFESFVDARDVDDEDDEEEEIPEEEQIERLEARGQDELNEMSSETTFEAEILEKSPFIYEEAWNLGDKVTVQSKRWGVTLNARVTEVREVYDRSGRSIEATFGRKTPTFIDKVKRATHKADSTL
ncbi:ReqiPepy6 Gp37-like protein [Salsuginibacillus halophilus]|uniref:ReqiPepy6 Gp37-like protein n=1 Tax=Salsuginibacillus halophilus TaxID=517424 RepID=A0A2P8H629_9BACI|nr:siphovirus ReqiPepy6 Gp37-like family protein [Salsuginibacillus halophilus]PSL41695.1 ReqiPepy6 Gp37-like protein [Salsuginibacillus halophilus]